MKNDWVRVLTRVLLALSLGNGLLADLSDSDRELAGSEVFSDGFPRTLFFRSGDIVEWDAQNNLSRHLGMFEADTRKYVGEETPFRQDWIDIMGGFKRGHPRKLSLLHLNGEARGVDREEGHRYFPGHWSYYAGEVLSQDLKVGDRLLSVSDTRVFSQRSYRKRERGTLTERLLPPVVIVPLNADSERDWLRSEYAQIVSVDEEAQTIELDRGAFFSEARSFEAAQAYVAPIHSEYWGSGTMWTLNLSSKCPRDAQGKMAGDIWLEEILEWCAPGGAAAHVDGITFDVIFYNAKWDGWDLDVDGVVDGGIDSEGDDFNARGQHALLKRLREAVGSEFILTSDSWEEKTQRAVGVFNGMESEGLCMPNDGWRKISQTINAQRYWAEQGNAKYQYSYITSKLRHPKDIQMADQLYRMGLGMACMLGVSYTEARLPRRKDGLPMIPEMHRGKANEPNWLGQPVDDMVMLPRNVPDLLANGAVFSSSSFVEDIVTENCQVSMGSDGSLVIEGTSEDPLEEMKLTLPGIRVAQGDLTVLFEAIAIDPLTGYEPGDRIPRQIIVSADGMPETPADQLGNRPMYNDIMALMGTSAWQKNCAYFRKAGEGAGSIDVTLSIENQGTCRIRNLTAHNGPMGIAREFERGVVLVNLSEETVTFDLSELFPEAYEAGIWRIKANPRDYVPSEATHRMLSIHNGRRLDTIHVEMPPLEGLFLCKFPQ